MPYRGFTVATDVSRFMPDEEDAMELGIAFKIPKEKAKEYEFGEPVNVLVSAQLQDSSFPPAWNTDVLHTKENDPGLQNAGTDEPGVWIRATDLCAIATLEEWCRLARMLGSPEQKVRNMEEIIAQIERWQMDNPALVKRPD